MIHSLAYLIVAVKMVMDALISLFKLLLNGGNQFFKLVHYCFSAVNTMLISMKLIIDVSFEFLKALMMTGHCPKCIKELIHRLPQFQALFGSHTGKSCCIY